MENGAKNKSIDHLKEKWDKYRLQTYPWDRPRGDEARAGRERAIISELRNCGALGIKEDVSKAEFEDLVMDTRRARGDRQEETA